jgi:hypothetical protein
MYQLLVPVAATFLLIGCGTSPTSLADAKLPPAERVYVATFAKTTNPAKLTVIRDAGLHGAEHVFQIFVNGTRAADLRQGEKLTFPVDSGQVFIEARMNNILGRVPPVQVETVFVGGKEYFYRVGLDELTLRLLRDIELTK